MNILRSILLIFCAFILSMSITLSQKIDKKYIIKDPFKKMHNWKEKKFPFRNMQILNVSKIKEKIIVINLWATSCHPCIEEIPLLNELVDKFKNEDILFYAASPEDSDKINHALEKTNFKYTIVANAQEIFTRLGLVGYPYNIVIDRKGVIRYISTGTVDLQGRKIAAYELPLAITEIIKKTNH